MIRDSKFGTTKQNEYIWSVQSYPSTREAYTIIKIRTYFLQRNPPNTRTREKQPSIVTQGQHFPDAYTSTHPSRILDLRMSDDRRMH